MLNYKHLRLSFVIIIFFCLIFSRKVYAYLDPGTGSYIFQMIIAILIGVTFSIKIFWRKVKTFIANLLSRRKNEEKNN